MSESAIRQAIFQTLKSIPDIGKVHDYERFSVDWSKFLALFTDTTGRILGWEITRSTVASERLNNLENQDSHRYLIKGYMGVQDAAATEKVFTAKVEQIRDRFRLDITLGGVCAETSAVSQVAGDTRMFGNVLCHYAELTITATEY